MKKQITIIAGHDTNEERERHTRTWLKQHGATIEGWNALQVLTFNRAELARGQYQDNYIVGFDDPEGNSEQSYLYISLEPDPHETVVYVEYEGSYSCTCKGKSCIKCNDELAAIERGENPYSHHTAGKEATA